MKKNLIKIYIKMEVSIILTIIFMSIGIIGCICMLDKHIKIKEKEEKRNKYMEEEIKKFNHQWNDFKKNRENIKFINTIH
jgi:hypothetical protein